MKKIAAGAFSFVLGLLLFAVGREIAFDTRSWPQLFSDGLSSVGKLSWVDTTLVTGLAAVAAAVFSIRAVKNQIEASDRAVQRQIDHVSHTERERLLARRDANRSVLPLSLAALSQYAEANVQVLQDLWCECVDHLLPASTPEAKFASVPSGTIASLKDMIESLDSGQRPAFRQLLVDIQIESSRIEGLIQQQRRREIIGQPTIETRMLGQATIYARAASFYRYARWETEELSAKLSGDDVATALKLTGAHHCDDHIIESYQLHTTEIWDPYLNRIKSETEEAQKTQ